MDVTFECPVCGELVDIFLPKPEARVKYTCSDCKRTAIYTEAQRHNYSAMRNVEPSGEVGC